MICSASIVLQCAMGMLDRAQLFLLDARIDLMNTISFVVVMKMNGHVRTEMAVCYRYMFVMAMQTAMIFLMKREDSARSGYAKMDLENVKTIIRDVFPGVMEERAA